MPRRARGRRPMAAAPGSPCPPAPLPPGCSARPRHRPPRPDPLSPPLPEPTAPLPAAGRITRCGKLGRRPCRRLSRWGEACQKSSRQDPKACPCLLTAAAWTGRLGPAPRPVPSRPSRRQRQPPPPGHRPCCASGARSSSNCSPGAGSSTDCGPGGCWRRRRRFRARERGGPPRAPPPRAHARSALCNNLHKG